MIVVELYKIKINFYPISQSREIYFCFLNINISIAYFTFSFCRPMDLQLIYCQKHTKKLLKSLLYLWLLMCDENCFAYLEPYTNFTSKIKLRILLNIIISIIYALKGCKSNTHMFQTCFCLIRYNCILFRSSVQREFIV